MKKERFDVVVVGDGHNGATTASCLSKCEPSVSVLESRPDCGGRRENTEVRPGSRIDPHATNPRERSRPLSGTPPHPPEAEEDVVAGSITGPVKWELSIRMTPGDIPGMVRAVDNPRTFGPEARRALGMAPLSAVKPTCRSAYTLMCRSRRGDQSLAPPPLGSTWSFSR